MESILVTGSNRGLGLEWARQYSQAGWRVYATCRDPTTAQDLQELAAHHPELHIHRFDVTREEDLWSLAETLKSASVDVLLNNAGAYPEKFSPHDFGRLDPQAWQHTYRVNTLGPVVVAETFVEQVARSSRRLMVMISSDMGSIAKIGHGGSYYYRSSKAALNAAARGLSAELKPRGIGVLIMHPGWVRTRMGGPDAPLQPVESVRGMRALVDRFDMENTGRFFRYDGAEMPW